MFCNNKKQVTIPQEFHFAIDERIPPPSTVVDLFDKVLDYLAILLLMRDPFSIAGELTILCFFSALFVFRTEP